MKGKINFEDPIKTVQLKLEAFDIKKFQIVQFEEKSSYILLSNPKKGVTHVCNFNPTRNLREDAQQLQDIPDPDVILANGSTVNKFVLFKNTQRIAYTAPCQRGKYIDKGLQIQAYDDNIQRVENSYLLLRRRTVFLINQTGYLFYIDLSAEDKSVYLVKDYTIKETRESGNKGTKGGLRPKRGTRFLSFQAILDEQYYILQSEKSIECYNQNFENLHIFDLNKNFVDYTIKGNDNIIFVIVKMKNQFQTLAFKVPRQTTKIEVIQKRIIQTVTGNPILDILHIGLAKFGTYRIQYKTYLYCWIEKKGKQQLIIKYFNGLTKVQDFYKFKGCLSNFQALAPVEPVQTKKFCQFLNSRVPLHVASIQNGNLVPLQNGLNNFEQFVTNLQDQNFLGSCVEYIKFGHLEKQIGEMKKIRIVAIIGRQSSGKSYLMNRLFGTRFDVAAHRCTDGIWMSVSHINDKSFIILDCEGLFSADRSTQDEVKLCLLLTAISDVLILNSDLSSNRNIQGLFEEFALGQDRLKGKNLFKGYLDIVFRDIADGQEQMAQVECQNFINKVIEKGQSQTIIKLFDGNIINSIYHNFQKSKKFDKEVENYRYQYIQKIPYRWKNGKDLLLTMKTLLSQIFADDQCSLDYRAFQLKSQKTRKLFTQMLENPTLAKKHLPTKLQKHKIKINSKMFSIQVDISQIEINPKQPSKPFQSIFESFLPRDLKSFFHNQWYQQLQNFMKNFFVQWKQHYFQFLKNQLPQSKSAFEFVESQLARAGKNLQNIIQLHYLCLGKCKQCDILCTKDRSHQGSCDCRTNHKCVYKCDVCTGRINICNLPAGHKSRHICQMKKHVCQRKCSVDKCQQQCVYDADHDQPCKCSSLIHPCPKKCLVHEMCKGKCKEDRQINHKVHQCASIQCPYPCIFNDGAQCTHTNHLHHISDSIQIGPSPISGKQEKIHLCDNDHPCSKKCQYNGICYINLNWIPKIHTNEYNTFTYNYAEQIAIRNDCKKVFKRKNTTHKGRHRCHIDFEDHHCNAKCPDCGVYCNLPFNHRGVHKSNVHRNKDRCIFISTKTTFKKQIQSQQGSALTVKFSAGEPAAPEICDQSCIRRGRGHVHPMVCYGGDLCRAITEKGHAIHSTEKFYANVNEGRSSGYDLVDCSTYWRIHGWEPPIESKNPAAQKNFMKCNFMCNHPSHAGLAQPVFCQDSIFHSESTKYNQHRFRCHHPSTIFFDIVFIIDSTHSMAPYFPEVKSTINAIIEKWKKDIDARFGIVSYTDHGNESGEYSSQNPIWVFPNSQDMNQGTHNQAIEFISRLKTSGGWQQEAMIDGLNGANSLMFRQKSQRVYVHVGDQNPHGNQFSDDSKYPDGCPCGIEWRDILRTMKSTKVEFIFCKLNERVNKTFEMFNFEYGGTVKNTILKDALEFTEKVTFEVSKIIEKNLELVYR